MPTGRRLVSLSVRRRSAQGFNLAIDVLDDLIDGEARRTLARRIVHEGLQEHGGFLAHVPHQIGFLTRQSLY